MASLLDGKVALVTGVSHEGQVGQAVAQTLARQGATLGIAARSQSEVEARAKELEAGGARVLALAADLAQEIQVRQLVERLLKEYGRIDILINLAGGLTRYKPVVDHTVDDWNAEVSNNLLTAFLLAGGLCAYAGCRRVHCKLLPRRTASGEHGGL